MEAQHPMLWMAFALLPAWEGLLGQQPASDLPSGTVQIEAFTPFGEKIKDPILHLYSEDRKRDFAKGVDGTIIHRVPYGRYTLVVAPGKGGGIGERVILVNAEHLWVVIGVVFPFGDRLWPGGGLAIQGATTPPPKDPENWWVRVEGVYVSVTKEARLKRDGTFHLGGLEMGKYLVELFKNSDLRRVQPIEIDLHSTVTRISVPTDGAVSP